jgi:hypothetical protein
MVRSILLALTAELARLGHFKQRGKVFSSSAIASMLGGRHEADVLRRLRG